MDQLCGGRNVSQSFLEAVARAGDALVAERAKISKAGGTSKWRNMAWIACFGLESSLKSTFLSLFLGAQARSESKEERLARCW